MLWQCRHLSTSSLASYSDERLSDEGSSPRRRLILSWPSSHAMRGTHRTPRHDALGTPLLIQSKACSYPDTRRCSFFWRPLKADLRLFSLKLKLLQALAKPSRDQEASGNNHINAAARRNDKEPNWSVGTAVPFRVDWKSVPPSRHRYWPRTSGFCRRISRK